MSIVLTPAQNRFLRGMAHDLKALLQIGGKGVTPAFLAELDEVLERHELIKVKIAAEDREARETMVAVRSGVREGTELLAGSVGVVRAGTAVRLPAPAVKP